MRLQDFNALLRDWICQTRFDRRHKTKGKAKLFQEATFYGFSLFFHQQLVGIADLAVEYSEG